MELISEKLFKEHSPVRVDTDVADFTPYINIAQILYINRILGPALLTQLETQIKEATEWNEDSGEPYPISDLNKALLLKIAPPLSFYATYQGLPFHWAAILNKGVTILKSENSETVDVNDIAQLRRWIKDDAEVLLKDLIEYLCKCAVNYPLWTPGSYCGGGCTPKKSTYDFGIFIPTRR